MEIESKNDGVQPVSDDSREPEGTIPEAASNLPLKRTARPRKDRAEFHATKHGILARPLLGALARRGENIRQLRVIERMLREKLQINGIFAELLFDRAWSSFLRCLLIARTEARVLTSEGPPSDLSFIPNLPKLPKSDFSFDDVSVLRLHQIALIQRYDAHFSRDFHGTMGLLMAMRDGGNVGLTKQLEKSYGKGKEDLTEE